MAIKHLLLVGFGGPTEECCGKYAECPGLAHCFVNGIFGDNPARKARVDEVVAHYEELGGYSRFNEITQAQGEAIQSELSSRGIELDLHVGYDHWLPKIADKVGEIPAGEEFLVLVMAPHQSSISWDGYLRRVSEGLDQLGDEKPTWAGVVDPWWNKRGFIQALAERIESAAAKLGADVSNSTTGLILSAHAVPLPVVKTSNYVDQIKETGELVAKQLNAANWLIAFQSAPSDSKIEWTKPYVDDAIPSLKDSGAQKIIAAPIGFLCDNVEVLYDLGIEGDAIAKAHELPFAVAEAVNIHPGFISMLADQVEAKISALAATST